MPTTAKLHWLTIFLGVALIVLVTSAHATGRQSHASVCDRMPGHWTPDEGTVWRVMCQTGSADFSGYTNKPIITGTFLEKILVEEPYVSHIASSGLRVRGAIVSGPFKLIGKSLNYSLFFVDCTFQDLVDLSDTNVHGTVSFSGSNLFGGLRARRAQLSGSLLLGAVDQDDAHLDSAPPQKIIIGGLDAGSVRLAGNLSIMGALFTRDINLPYSTINGMLDVESAVGYGFSASSSKIDGQIDIIESDFSNSSEFENSQSKLNSILFFGVAAGEGVFLDRSKFDNLSFKGATITGELDLLGTSMRTLDLSDAIVNGQIDIGYNRRSRDPLTSVTRWVGRSELLLNRAKLAAIKGPENSQYWPRKIDFSGFSIGNFVPGFLAPSNYVAQAKITRANIQESALEAKAATDEKSSVQWWENEPPEKFFPEWLSRNSGSEFETEPYKQVSIALETAGAHDAANSVGYAGRNQELIRVCRSNDWFHCFLLFFSMVTIGYGYAMGRSVILAACFVFLGAFIFRKTPEAVKANMPIGIIYSFDMFLPIVKLRESNYKIEISGLSRYYFYFHKLMGWFLGSYIVAGLTGIAR